MEVKPRYKQTEYGVLPADWDAGPIGRAVEELESGASVNSEKDEAPEFDSYPRVLKTGAAREGAFDPRESKKVARRDLWRLKVSLRKDTILVSRMNTAELVGESGYVAADYPNLFVPDRMWMATIRRTGRVHPRWLSYILTWQPVKSQISASATGTSGSMKNISKPSFRAVEIPYPRVEEQRAIAEALSDADAFIEFLEQLLAKKRQIKQGAMQELLTGKKRLPGFGGKWEVKRLDELGRWTGGMTPSMRNSDYWQSGTVPWISSGDVKSAKLTSTAFSISETAITQRATTLLPAKSIILVTRSGILRKYLPVAMNMIPMAINQDIKALLPHDDALPEYLLQSLTCSGPRILARCLKSGTTVESIEFSWLKAFTIPIPTIPEQGAIAAILADMDAEIEVVEGKLVKGRALKRGMMQKLLTGAIRLPVDEPVSRDIDLVLAT